jgi:hypothetical protein
MAWFHLLCFFFFENTSTNVCYIIPDKKVSLISFIPDLSIDDIGLAAR